MIGSKIHHYEILKKLGEGGQGAVYKARDTKLDREVVLKVLPAELTSRSANFKRFEREAKLCSQLDHPNICTIYDYHEDNGTFYIAMQYVHGDNVRQLVNGKALELKSALNIAIQVCDALAYAHKRNIIHRDIKAGNVMVSEEGNVKILDFGLAKLMEGDQPTGKNVDRTDLTELGIPYGTATYAAPEQAKGEETDHRADIFSTGVLLYELLTGIWAFQGKTVVDVRHQILHGTPVPLSEMRPDAIPPRLQEILNKALEKEPRDRYQKIATMRDDLRSVLQEVTGVQTVDYDAFRPVHLDSSNPVKRAWNWLTGKSSSGNTENPETGTTGSAQLTPTYSPDMTYTTGGKEKKSIAILPFKNLGNDEESDFYEFALADAVITELAQLQSLIVRPSSVIARYQGKDIDEREVGRELRVHAVLTAGFLRSGGKMRVTAQLLDVISGDILWSDRVDAEGEDILALQDVIAFQILDGLRLELTDREQEVLNRRPTDNAEAYEQYLRGRDSFGRFIFRTVSNDDCEQAIADFKAAIELDPKFALAHSGLGASYTNRVFKGMGEATDYELAAESFSKAIEYDENVPEARVLMIIVHLARGEKATARTEIKKLEELFPNEAPLYFIKGTMHRLDGQFDEALKSFSKLGRLDPAALVVASYNRARVYSYQNRYDKALKELDRGAKVEPNHPMIRIFRAATLYYLDQNDKALEIMAKVLDENEAMEGIRPLYAILLAGSGKPDEARKQLSEEALSISRADHDMAYWAGAAFALLDETDLAFEWLNRAVSLGNENLPLYKTDRSLKSIRSDIRFEELMNRMRDRTL